MTFVASSRRARAALLVAVLSALLVAAAPACGPSSADVHKKADFHYKLASNFFYDKNTQSAIKELYTAIEIDPKHAEAHHLLGFIYFGRRDHIRALKHLRTAVTLKPDFDEGLANLGNLYLALEQWQEAVPYFEKLLDRPLYKTPYLAHNNLGWALFNLGHPTEARMHFDQAVFLNPQFCLGYNNLGRLHAQEGQTRRALEAFHKAAELCPAYIEPHYFLGRIYAALEAAPRAHEHFQRCHELGPETPYGRRCGEAL